MGSHWGDHGDDSEGEGDEPPEIRTLDARKELLKIRTEKRQTLARVKALLFRSEDILAFDIEAEEFETG